MVSKSNVAGGLLNNPSIFALAALGIGLFLFRDKISNFFSKVTGGAEGAAQIAEVGGILGQNLTSNLTATPLPSDPLFGESGIFTKVAESISSFEPPDILGEINKFFTNLIPTAAAEEPIPIPTESTDFTSVGAAGARSDRDASRLPAILPNSEEEFAQIMEQTMLELPTGFIGGGLSFIGGTINEIPLCNLSIGDIAEKFGISASAAANKKFIECEESNFDFGTNTGSGFSPDNPFVVTGGATLESEAIKAACTSCELFNLNCEQCRRGLA